MTSYNLRNQKWQFVAQHSPLFSQLLGGCQLLTLVNHPAVKLPPCSGQALILY